MSERNLDEQYFTVRDVAQMLQYQESTIREFIRSGQLRATKIGKEYRIAATDLRMFLKRGENAPDNGDDIKIGA